jgi:hypothetical protein
MVVPLWNLSVLVRIKYLQHAVNLHGWERIEYVAHSAQGSMNELVPMTRLRSGGAQAISLPPLLPLLLALVS